MKIKLPVLMEISRRLTAVTLACTMLFNLTSEAAAQYRSFSPTGGGVPPFDYKVPIDNTRVASKRLDIKLQQAKLNSESASLHQTLSYQQVKQEVQKANQKSPKAVPLSEAVYQAIYQQYLQEVNKQDKEVNTVFNLLKKEYNPQYSFDDAYKQGATFAQKHNGSFEGAKVCQDGKCVDYVNYAQGYLRTQIYQGSGADQKKGSKFYWNREVMLAHVPEIYGALKEGGVHRADKNKLQSYLKYVLEKADDYCDNDFYIVDYMPGLGSSFNGKSNGKKSDAQQGKERRQKECDNIGKAMLALGMITETGTERMANAQIIYNIMKDTYKDDYGAITAVNGTAALIAIGSVGSYKYIDRFLTVDTLKGATDFGTVWNGCKWVLNLLSIQSWVERGTNINNRLRGRGGRYLNQLGAVYQYVDYDASRAMGVSDFNIRVMQTNPSLGYNIAYGNVLEDLGRMIASTGTRNGNAIASRIVNIYASNVKSKGAALDNVHTPLVAGVLAAGTIKTANATYAAQKMNSFDWWDLNEATQRRINNIVAHYSGTVKRSKDQSKVKRNERNQKIIQASVWADMFVSAIFMAMLIASIPNIARNIGMLVKNVSRIRAINAAGKGNLLKITRANIKAAGVKPAAVKATLNAQRAAKAEQAAVARAARAAQEREAAIKSATEKVRQARVKPQTEQIQYTLLTKEGKSALVNDRGVLTAVVGEGGSGASAPAKAVTEIKAIKPEPVRYAGYKGTAGETPRVYTPKPSKVVDAARVKKALFRANVDQGVSIVRQLKNSLKTRFGATILAVNMSLTNPAMLTAATSGKAMPIIETLAGTEKVGAFGKSIGGTVRSAATVSNTTAKIVKTPEILKVAQAAKTPIKALPDFDVLKVAAIQAPLALPKISTISDIKQTVKKANRQKAAALAEDQALTASSALNAPLSFTVLWRNATKKALVTSSDNFVTPLTIKKNSNSKTDRKEIIREEQAIATAWNKIKTNPVQGKMNDVMAKIQVDDRVFIIQHGAAIREKRTGKILVQGSEVKRATGTYDNFGLTKIIFKHGADHEVMSANGVTKQDVLSLPTILREYEPIASESKAGRLTYRVKNDKGTLFVLFAKNKQGKYMLVTMFYEQLTPEQTVVYSPAKMSGNMMTQETAVALKQAVGNNVLPTSNDAKEVHAPLIAANPLPVGWKLMNEVDLEKHTLTAETRVAENFLKGLPSPITAVTSDPVTLASFFLMPIIMKMTGGKSYKAAKDQAFSFRQQPAAADDLIGSETNGGNINFTESGFLLSYEDRNNQGKEIVLPVDLDIDNSFKVKGYNRVFFNKEGIAELRNNSKPAKVMSGFFMKLGGYTQDFAEFISLAQAANLEKSLKVKLVQVNKRRSVKVTAVKLYTPDLKPLNVDVELPISVIGKGDTLVMLETGELAILKANSNKPEVIEAYYIRLPKNQINNLVKILKDSPRRFAIEIGTTKDKAGVVIKEVSMTNVSLGKTFAPVVKTSLGMTEADATSLMFVINYLLPGLSSFLNPVLKKVGERKLLLISLGLSLLSGVVATASGFYGFVDSMPHSSFRTAAFITSVSLMAISAILKQLVSNMLIRANRGDAAATKMTAADSKAAAQAKAEAAKPIEKVSFADLMKRSKEVFTKKSDLSLQDAFFYNLSFMFKNFGTLLFLALPYAINLGVELATGTDLGLDFSFSFPIYAAFSAATLLKTYNAHLRDAYDTKPQAKESVRAAAKAANMTVAEYEKKLKEADKASKVKEMSTESVALAAAEAKDHNILDVFLHKKGVVAVSTAMALATVHEFVLSSSFASILQNSLPDSSAANFWVALCLYIPLVLGRLLGNVAGQRMSSSSLYIVCSALSAVGTAIMAAFVGSPLAVMIGASIASFGVGNFFTQMYNYITDKHKEYNREISIILALTMSVAAFGSMPARYLVEGTGVANIGLIYAMVCLGASLALTGSMMKGSTIYKFIAGEIDGHKSAASAKKGTAPVKDGVLAKDPVNKEQLPKDNGEQIPPVDMNNPLPN